MHIHFLKADFVPRVNNMGITTILSHSSEVLQEKPRENHVSQKCS